jgi:hypothetical protein
MENSRLSSVIVREPRVVFYGRFLIFVAGLGGAGVAHIHGKSKHRMVDIRTLLVP